MGRLLSFLGPITLSNEAERNRIGLKHYNDYLNGRKFEDLSKDEKTELNARIIQVQLEWDLQEVELDFPNVQFTEDDLPVERENEKPDAPNSAERGNIIGALGFLFSHPED